MPEITKKVNIKAVSTYEKESSRPVNNEYIFSYKISIANNTSQPIRLLSRFWTLVDGMGNKKIVEGEGVVGQQPIIEPGGQYHYISGCHLTTDIGKMFGEYKMLGLNDEKSFFVTIPSFKLIAPFKNN